MVAGLTEAVGQAPPGWRIRVVQPEGLRVAVLRLRLRGTSAFATTPSLHHFD